MGKRLVENYSTIEKLAFEFGLSPSMARYCIKNHLPELDPKLYERCEQVIRYNKSVSHLRAGQATKMKYRIEGINK